MDHSATQRAAAKMSLARSTNKNSRCDPPEAKRLVIVDDHPLFRKGLEQLIHSDSTFAVCGEASNASEAMEVIRRLHPDLGDCGSEFARR